MSREFGFYYKELLLGLQQYFPVIVACSIFVVLILLVIFVTRKLTDRRWLKEPDKLEKATKVVVAQYKKEAERLKREYDRLSRENRDLREIINSAANTLNNLKKEIK